MRRVTIHHAKTHLSRLLEQATKYGESFIITKAGKPLVKVVPLERPDGPKRRIGFLKGRCQVPDDIKAIGREETAAIFKGEG